MPSSFPPMRAIAENVSDFALFIEELEHAGGLLATARLAKERMALVILDSLAERLLYQHAHRHFDGSESMPFLTGRPHSAVERTRILGDFNAKVALAARNKEFPLPEPILDELDAAVFRVAHRYRNAGYHRAEHNDVLVGPLARLYCQAVGRALVRATPAMSSGGLRSNALAELDRFNWRDGGEPEGWIDHRAAASAITDQISGPLVVETVELADRLAMDFEARCEGVALEIEDLRRDGLKDDAINSLLEAAQHWVAHRADPVLLDLKEEERQIIAAGDDPNSATEERRQAYRENQISQLKRMDALMKETDLRFDLESPSKLRRRAEKIRQKREPAPLLELYRDLDQQLEELEAGMNFASMEWDRHVQTQLDIARGK